MMSGKPLPDKIKRARQMLDEYDTSLGLGKLENAEKLRKAIALLEVIS